MLEVFSFILTKQGYEVEAMNNPENVPDKVETFSPDLLLLDVKMKNADGRDLCKKIKEKYNKVIPVILMSSNAALLEEHKDCLVVDTVEKPFDLKTFTKKISSAIGMR